MFIAFVPNLKLRAPAERNVRVDGYIEPYFRSAGAKNLIDRSNL